MALFTAAALVLMSQGSSLVVPAPEAAYDVGYDELLANDNLAAREAIEACETLPADDPARLINHGIALARTGDYEAARASFEAVAEASERVELETAEGEWVDSRRLARRALAMLDKGEFARYYALSLR